MVFVGVHPVLTHVPPRRSRSIKATVQPWSASFWESGVPAWPDPITMASNFVIGLWLRWFVALARRIRRKLGQRPMAIGALKALGDTPRRFAPRLKAFAIIGRIPAFV